MTENLNSMPEKIEIEFLEREDGVYLHASHNSNIYKLDANKIADIIKAYGIENPDVMNISLFLQSRMSEVRIADKCHVAECDEKVFIEFTNNDMVASVSFAPPLKGGDRFDSTGIFSALTNSGIIFGIDNTMIEQLANGREYFVSYEVAFGKPAINGIDGRLEFFFDTKKKLLKPKVMDNGTVDFMNLDMIQKTYIGTELVKVIEPTPGINGVDVKGTVLYAKPGKPSAKLPKGKNVIISEDELQLFSGIDGQIDYNNNKINVLPILEINSDVDLSTGHIDFNGAVIVKGGVRENFSVKARGVVEIMGTVEGATIQSDTDIILNSGVMGADKAKIIAGGNLVTKFIDSANVIVSGNITADSIMHSYVECNGEIILDGKNGLIVGGTIWAVDKIVANEVGSHMATKTTINIGKTPSLGETGDTLFKQLDDIKFKVQKLEKIIDTLKALGSSIKPEQKELLLKSNHTKILLATEQRKLTREIEELNNKISAKRAKLSVKNNICAGVILTMGSARRNFDKHVQYATFVNKNGTIEEVPFSE